MISLLQAGFWSKPNPFCFRRIQLQSPGSAPFMSFIMASGMLEAVVYSISWVSSAYMWWSRRWSSIRFARSSVKALNFWRHSRLPIPVAHCSRLCEGAIVDLWPGRFVFDHWDMTRTTSEPYFSHRIDRAAPVTWLNDLQCRKHVVQ